MTFREWAGGDKVAGPIPISEETIRMLTTQSRAVNLLIRERPELLAENRRSLRRQVEPYRPLHAVLADGAWSGEPCFIIGGGPSLRDFDFERLRGRGRIIAINKAYIDVPFADVVFFMDYQPFYQRIYKGDFGPEALQKWKEFQGYKVFLNIMGRRLEDVYSVRSLGRVGLSNSLKMGIYHGNNSGVGSIGLAVALRANPIYLLGIDGRFEGGLSHYHGGYGRPVRETVVRSFIRDFERISRFIRRTRYRVINLNPRSAIGCFKFSSVDEVLNGQSRQDLGHDRGDLQQRECVGQCPSNP